MYFLRIYIFIPSLVAVGWSLELYKDVYPDIDLTERDRLCDPLNSTTGTCPLFFGLLFSFGGNFTSNGAIPGVQIALREINEDPDILPGYTLHYTLKDTNMFQPPVKLGIIGAGCSVATEAVAEVAYYYNLTQISCASSSPSLTNRVQYKTYYQMLASEAFLSYGYYGIVKHFKWRRVSIIVQDEALFTGVISLVTEQLRADRISYTETRFLTSEGVNSLEDRLFDSDSRIFLLSMYSPHAIELLCRAYLEDKYYPRYQFILLGWYDREWWVGDEEKQRYLMETYNCTLEHRETVLVSSLSIVLDEFLTNYSKVIDSGNTGYNFYDEYDQLIMDSMFKLQPTIYAQQCYDGVWTLARALNDTLTALRHNDSLNDEVRQFNSKFNERFGLEHFTYNNSAMLNVIQENIANTDFAGLTGRIIFNEDGVKQIQYVTVEQYRIVDQEGTIERVRVSGVDFSNTSDLLFQYDEGINDTNLWPRASGSGGDGLIPYDGIPMLVQATVKLEVTIIYSILASAGLVLTAVCITFNFAFRKKKLMKLSSPNLNYLIGAGAAILYIDIFFFIIPTTSPSTVSILCNFTPWLTTLGYSLCYGTILMKMGRIFYIFNNVMSTTVKKTIHDWMLAIGVLILVIIDVTILSVYSIVNRDNLTVVSVVSEENPQDLIGVLGIVKNFYIYICDSSSRNITISVLNGFKAVLQVIALIFAFSIRKVKVKGLDDSPFVIASIYVTSIVLAVIFVSSITLKDYENVFACVYCTGFCIGTTVILLLVFVPKMVGLYRDPDGENIFKNVAPQSEMTVSSPQRKISAVSLTESIKGLNRKCSNMSLLNRQSTKKDQSKGNGHVDTIPQESEENDTPGII